MTAMAASDIYLIEPMSGLPGYTGPKSVPLGIGYICAALKAGGYPYVFEDLDAHNNNLLALRKRLLDLSPKIIGVSCSAWSRGILPRIFQLARECCPQAVLVAGGALVRHCGPKFLDEYAEVDIVVKGEGEETFPEICRARELGGDSFFSRLEGVLGIVYRWHGEVRETPRRPIQCMLDDLASPFTQQVFRLDTYNDTVTLLSSRGCPYNCIYCQWGSPRLPYRQHGVPYIVGELRVLREQGIEKISFGDGTFNVSTSRLLELSRAFGESGFRFEIHDADCRADLFDARQARILKELGVVDVGFGLESVNRETQKLIRKNLDPAAVSRAVSIAREHGLGTHVSMMVGLPGEGPRDVLETMRFIEGMPVDHVGVFPLRTQEGTELTSLHGKGLVSLMPQEEIDRLLEVAYGRFRMVNPNPEHLRMRHDLGMFLAD